MRHLRIRPLAAVLALALLASDPATVAGDGGATAILAVGFDRADSTAAPVARSDLRVRSATGDLDLVRVGEPGELAGDWQIAVYVDQEITGTRSILRYLEGLAGHSAELTGLGEVQLVLAGDERSTVVRTSDPALLEEVLFQQSLRSAGIHRLRELRLELLEALETSGLDRRELITAAFRRERAYLRERRDELIDWVAAQGRSRSPRALLFLSDALGADSRGFYGSLLDDDAEPIAAAGRSADLDELAKVLASYGWMFVPTVVPADAEEDDDALSLRTNRSIGFRLRLGGRDETEEEAEEPAPDLRLDEGRASALSQLASLTGGHFAPTLEEVPAILDDLASRRPVEIVLPAERGRPTAVELEVRDPGVAVRAPQWIGGRPEAVAEVRIRRSLAGDGDPGDLPLRATIQLDAGESPDGDAGAEGVEDESAGPAELDLAIDLSHAEPGRVAPLRVSVGVHTQDGGLEIHHEVVEADPAEGSTFRLERPLDLPSSTDAAIVVVEDLDRDLWGESFAEFVTAPAAVVGEPDIPEVAPSRPAGPALLLEPLPAGARTGKVRVRTKTRGDVREVVFLVDGERVGRQRRSPFDMRVDLGDVPEQRSIIAIAYDSEGQELGRDGLVVNEAATNFWVQIVEPRASDRVGPVDVVTSYRLPESATLEKIDYYWNDDRIATTRDEPHRQRLLIPVDRPAGYIRVVATLDDGRTAEDVVLMNTQRFESEILVELVELYVVVTDRSGKPVRGLDRSDFVIREEQEVQEVESFAIAGDLPLTLGLAIDSSLSLFKKLPEVQAAATRFVESLKPDRDRAFLVGYGSQPKLVRSTTANLGSIVEGIDSLDPSGNTAVWEAVSLSLEQLEQANGRKALVVFYDGDDEDESYSFKKTLDTARRSRIPIYLIVMNDEAARTQGKGFSVRSRIARLDQLARTGGGRVFFVRTDDDLSPIFADISAELRSHYLLTYYPQRPVQEPEWRPISVELTRSDLTARTLSGYGGG